MKTLLLSVVISLSLMSCNSAYKLNGLYVTDYSFGIDDLDSEPNFDLIVDLINSNYFEASAVYLDFKNKHSGIRHFKYVDSNYSVPFEYIKTDEKTIRINYDMNKVYNVNKLDDDLLYLNIHESILKYDAELKEWYYTMKLDNNMFVIYTLKKIKKL